MDAAQPTLLLRLLNPSVPFANTITSDATIPKTYKEAMARPDFEKVWLPAMKKQKKLSRTEKYSELLSRNLPVPSPTRKVGI